MKAQFLKIAGVTSESEFYKKYPTEEAFFTAHPEAMQMKHGGAVDLNAFYNQPRFIQTNIMQNGGPASEPRTLLPIVPSMVPGINDIIDGYDIVHGAATGNKTQMNQGIIGMAAPGFAGKALPAALDYVTEKTLGKKVADDNQTKREGILNLSTSDTQKLFTKYGPGGYDKWKAAGFPKLENGGPMLPEFQFAGPTMTQNNWYNNPQVIKKMQGPAPQPTIKVPDPTLGQPNLTGNFPVTGATFDPNAAPAPIHVADNLAGKTNFTGGSPVSATPFDPNAAPGTMRVADNEVGKTNFTGAAPTSGSSIDMTGKGSKASQPYAWQPTAENLAKSNFEKGTPAPAAPKPTGPSTLGPGQYKMQEVAKHQMIGNKMYKNISDLATMPLYNPAIGMMSDNGLSGYLKMGLGALAGVSGIATGLDNVWRGFKARKPDATPEVNTNPNATGNTMNWSDPKNAAALNQESVQQEAQRKAANTVNPPAQPPIVPPMNTNAVDLNRTAAYGGMIKAGGGMQVPGTTPQPPQPTDYTQNGNPVYVGKSRLAVDLEGGLNRTLGANAGISMFNNALGFKQGMKSVRENAVKAGMSDFAYQPDDTNWMPMGYDTLNTGPGQTQAPNLYTPVQYTGMQMQSQFEEGGEYDLTEEEIQQILAAGGEVEFM
jgi:hypothetical protein